MNRHKLWIFSKCFHLYLSGLEILWEYFDDNQSICVLTLDIEY